MPVNLFNKYIQSLVARNLRPNYIIMVSRTLRDFNDHLNVSPQTLTPQHIIDYLATLQPKLKAPTLVTKRGILIAWLNWCSREEYIPACEWSKRIPKPRTDEQVPNALTPDEARRFLTALLTASHNTNLVRRRDIAMFFVLLDTGIREGELLRLEIGDVDINQGELRISSESKARKQRRVWVSIETRDKLRSYLRLRKKMPGEFLWTTRFKTRPCKSLLLQNVKRYARLAGISNLTVHQLRHTALTQMCRSGMSLPAVSAIAGHSTTRTTERYLHLINEDVRRELEKHQPISKLA